MRTTYYWECFKISVQNFFYSRLESGIMTICRVFLRASVIFRLESNQYGVFHPSLPKINDRNFKHLSYKKQARKILEFVKECVSSSLLSSSEEYFPAALFKESTILGNKTWYSKRKTVSVFGSGNRKNKSAKNDLSDVADLNHSFWDIKFRIIFTFVPVIIPDLRV